MRAWLIDKLEGLDHLHLAEVADPAPAEDEVVLRVQYASLNPADRYLAFNQYPAKPALPHILGRDGVGVIEQIGADVRGDWRIGQPALILRSDIGVNRWGTFAERVSVPADCIVPVPDEWSPQQAAAGVLVYLTAYQALTQWGPLEPGGVVLVTGISGGVGVASIHLGTAMDQTVIGLSRNKSKWPTLKQLGAAEIYDLSDPNWRREIKARFGERKVNLAIDNIGGSLLNEVIDTLGMWGKASIVGRLAGPTPQFNSASLFFRRLRLGGVALSSWTNGESHAAWSEVVKLMRKINARPQVDQIFPFDQLPAAFAHLEKGPLGKVLLHTA